MTLLEWLDAKINSGSLQLIHLTSEMCQQLICEDIQRWQDGAKDMRFGVDHETGQQFYRGIPIKVVGTGLRLEDNE